MMHAVGDTIGFKNGEWEFMRQKLNLPNSSNRIIEEFIDLGGINNLDTTNWIVSDDTVLHLALLRAVQKNKGDLYENIKKEFIKAFDDMENREPGLITSKYVKYLKDHDWKETPFDIYGYGSGCSMRTPCLGFVYKDDLDKLLEVSLFSSHMTHTHPVGYLGGLVSALFVYYGCNNIDIQDWSKNMVELFESEKIDKIIEDSHIDSEIYKEYKYEFINTWRAFNDVYFNDETTMFKFIAFRMDYFLSIIRNRPANYFIGSSGHDSVIIAYHALLECSGSFEKLVVYSMLHMGDSDTTGCIAGAFFSIVYGTENVPIHYFENLEKKEEIKKLARF